MKANKKGFTIVELVIVIAVIAILAAVLIPTFNSVIKKANKSAAQQTASHAYTIVASEYAQSTALQTATIYIKVTKGSADYYFAFANGSTPTDSDATAYGASSNVAVTLTGEAATDVGTGVEIKSSAALS